MRRALLLLSLLTSCAHQAPSLPEVPLLFNISFGRASGIVLQDGWVLTVAHILPVNEVTHQHPTLDLALLYMPDKVGSITIAHDAPQLGDPLLAIGWHYGIYLLHTEGFQGGDDGLMSCPVVFGCSGGPVLNAAGELVGIIDAVHMTPTFDSTTHESAENLQVVPHIAWYTPLNADVQDWIRRTINR